MLRVGTRGSALALAQTRRTLTGIAGIEIVTIESSGAPTDDKSRWTRSLESALLADEIDIAVHSAKDVPTERPRGIVTAAVPKREDPRDRICGVESIAALGAGARVGTASPRRTAQLLALRDDIEAVELRGNVDTRLRRLAEGEVDAIVLAAAGLNRLDHGSTGMPLDVDSFTPAAGQGTLLLECREGDGTALSAVQGLDDDAARVELLAERAVVEGLDADCHTALGVLGRCEGGHVTLSAVALSSDGTAWIRDRAEGPADAPTAVAAGLVQRMRAAGVEALLATSRGEAR